MSLKQRLGNFLMFIGAIGIFMFIASVLAEMPYDVWSLLWGVALFSIGLGWRSSKPAEEQRPAPKPAPPPKPVAPKAPPKPGFLTTLLKGPRKAAPPPPPPPKPKGLAALFKPRSKK
jgi:hypothetical protein